MKRFLVLFALLASACFLRADTEPTLAPLSAEDRAIIVETLRQDARSDELWSEYYATTDIERHDRALLARKSREIAAFIERYTPPQAPHIVTIEGNALANVGQTVVLVARVTGTGPFKFRWQRPDGSEMTGWDRDMVMFTATSTLQTGAYQCTVTNAWGSDALAIAVVIKHPPL